MPDPAVFDVHEETSGSYVATVKDDLGALIPASLLQTLQLTLYVIREDGSTAIVNSRNHQNVLNQNQVTVYDALQTLPDGRTYNLRWRFTLQDTTLVEQLPYESHRALFEWTAPDVVGKHEVVLRVRNLTMVPVS